MTPEKLRSLLEYDPETGILTWRRRPDGPNNWNTRYAGKEAFTSLDGKGYRCGNIFGKMYRAHRVAYIIWHGQWPDDQIDHINGIRDDNRICNLRDVSQSTNMRNAAMRNDNTSGHCGVYWHKQRQKWQARIRVDRNLINLGVFTDIDDAIAARKAAEQEHNFSANHGRKS